MKTFKRIVIILAVILIIMQAFRTPKNNSHDTTGDISKSYTVPEDVKTILAKACNDCHSNNTVYPWYAAVQPVSWWLGDHITEGKGKLNLNEFSGYRIARQYKKMEDCIDEVKQGDMPLPAYTILHKKSILTEAEKQTLYNWFETVRDSIKAKYPADSLVSKKKK